MEEMDSADSPHRRASSFATQSNALMRKNLAFQKRNIKTNICTVSFPILLCAILVIIQKLVDSQLDKPENKCGCRCIDTNGNGRCDQVCGVKYSTKDQIYACAIPEPPEWPPLLQVPRPEFRAAKENSPKESCRKTQTCPVTVLFTGKNRAFATEAMQIFFSNIQKNPNTKLGNLSTDLSQFILGSDTDTRLLNFAETAFFSGRPLYNVQSNCDTSSLTPFNIPALETFDASENGVLEIQCIQNLNVWKVNSSLVNDALFNGYHQANTDRIVSEFMAAYDFLNSTTNNLNVDIWYNSTYMKNFFFGGPPSLVRLVRSVNLVTNAFLEIVKGSSVKIPFKFIKEMPKPSSQVSLDFSSLLGPLFFTWIVELIFPILLTYLVYEKEKSLRIMMKMHGLGDIPYWIISYGYFLLISIIYVLLFVLFGSLIGLKYFALNDHSIQFVFLFTYINLQIAVSFLLSTIFSKVKTAQAFAYIYIFGSGLLAANLFQPFVEDATFSRVLIIILELIPAFSLFRGLYEFGQYSFIGNYMGTSGMQWKNLNDSENGMKEVLIIMGVEWCLLLLFSYYLDKLISVGNRSEKNPLLFLQLLRNKIKLTFTRQNQQGQDSKVVIEVEKPDVIRERELVEKLLADHSTDFAIISDKLQKVYPGQDGNPDKLAVQGLSLALQHGECFGFLGPNGAGKTSFISMMIGLLSPTSGNAYVYGHSIQNQMDKIYSSMGVCPQHDMLWEMLTGREHLLFYGRLKNLKAHDLLQAVEDSLRSVNLFFDGVGDKQAGKYSGGMKRRLSVAISLIGDPKVVYLDEPSTGLDPSSRNQLWKVVKDAKRNRAIILTTHSMEEAEFLCDRLGIFVGGSMQCIGNPKQLKARYGGSYVFTLTTSQSDEQQVENLAHLISPNAKKTYHLSGTQKFEIPKQEVKISDVFQAVEEAKKRFTIQAWGLADTSLEDVFIKVAKGADSFDV